jgi:hypothetical protein
MTAWGVPASASASWQALAACQIGSLPSIE